MLKDKLPLVVLDVANSHMGNVQHGLNIIKEFGEILKYYPINAGIKLQYRHLDTFIQASFKQRVDLKYIKRFTETRLSDDEFKLLKDEIKNQGLISVCTPFDEQSVDLIIEHDFDIIKIASCSFTDWSLLEKVAKTNKPIIASIAGASETEIDHVVSFFEHRNKDFAILHCVAEYPTSNANLQLNQLDFLKRKYPDIVFGLSSHENPDYVDAVKMAIAKGATVLERHIGLPTIEYKLNAYSSSPQQIRVWLDAIMQSYTACGESFKRVSGDKTELLALGRGVFTKGNVKLGDTISNKDIYLAFPAIKGQLMASDLSKYTKLVAKQDIESDKPLLNDNVEITDERTKVYSIAKEVNDLLIKGNVCLPNKVDIEISHHYGIDKFAEYGMAIFTVINKDYCKKVLAMLPKQVHPEQSHKIKTETFYVLYGEALITLNGVTKKYSQGDMIHINIGVKHKIQALDRGVIIEELSTTHIKGDSYYTDESIGRNINRKTELTFWLKDGK